ncbi:hypothetical protein [Pyrobaculum islandicum]|nr:hypothetical protein [Pyrobaculum islandicum]
MSNGLTRGYVTWGELHKLTKANQLALLVEVKTGLEAVGWHKLEYVID